MSVKARVAYGSQIPEDLARGELQAADFTTTAKSRTEQLSRLYDGDLSTYYQTNSSCPHTITWTFKRPLIVKAIAFYRNSSDASYCPEDNSFVFTSPSGTTQKVTNVKFNMSTDWAIVTFEDSPTASSITYSIDKNHSCGCDSRIRQVKIFAGMGCTTIEHELSFQMIAADVCAQMPHGIKEGNVIIKCVGRSDEGSPELRCDEFVLRTISEEIGALIDEARPESGIKHIVFPYSQAMVKAIIAFGYGNMVEFQRLLSLITLRDLPELPKVKIPTENIVLDLSPAILLAPVAARLNATPLLSFIEDVIVNEIASHPKISSTVWGYLDALEIPTLTTKVTGLLSKRSDLITPDALNNMTHDQLVGLINDALTKNVVAKKVQRQFVVGARVMLNPDVSSYRWGRGSVTHGEVGVITSVDPSDGSLVINFPSQSGWKGIPADLIFA